MLAFFLLAVIAVTAHMLYIGNDGINVGVASIVDGMGDLSNEFTGLYDNSNELIWLSSDLVEQSEEGGDLRIECCQSSTTGTCDGPSPDSDVFEPLFDGMEDSGDIMNSAAVGKLSCVCRHMCLCPLHARLYTFIHAKLPIHDVNDFLRCYYCCYKKAYRLS